MPGKNVATLVVFLAIVSFMALPAHAQSPFEMSEQSQMMNPSQMDPSQMMDPYQPSSPYESSEIPRSHSQNGIGVSHAPIDIDILKNLDTDSAPGTTSYYDSKYRIAVVKNSLTYQKKMNSGRVAFGRQMESQYFNTRYWEPITLNGYVFWKLKDGVSKAEALNDFISSDGGKYKIDCAAAINIIFLKSKLDVVGESCFNKCLPTLIVRGWKTYVTKDGKTTEYKTLEKWVGNEYMPGSTENLQTGDYVYFKNHPMMEGTPEQGENAIFLGHDDYGRPVFFGLNIGIFKGIFNEYGILSSEKGSIDPKALKAMAEG